MNKKIVHFRKRQLLEYEVEIALNLAADAKDQIAYPSSPSSLGSGKTSPVEDVKQNTDINTPIKGTDAAPAIDLEKSTHFKAVKVEKLPSNPAPIFNNDRLWSPFMLSPLKNVAYKYNHDTTDFIDVEDLSTQPAVSTNKAKKLKEDVAELIAIQNHLRQSIEANLYNQRENAADMKPKPSTLLLAKLNEIKAKTLVQPTEPSTSKDLEAMHPIPSDNIMYLMGVDETLLKEKKQIVIHRETLFDEDSTQPQPAPLKAEPISPKTLPDLFKSEPISPISPSSPISQPALVKIESIPQKEYSFEELQKIRTRITGIFRNSSDIEQRMMSMGIDYHEITDHSSPEKFNDKSIATKTPKKTNGQRTDNFIHITADTLPEELIYPGLNSQNISSSWEISTEYPIASENDPNLLIIGPNGTLMPIVAWLKIDWSLAAAAITRKIMMEIFDRDTLATHSLTGRPSPAFKDLNKPEKKALDSAKVADIVYLVTSRHRATPKEVRMAITTKCADECKMLKWREQKQLKIDNKENNRINPN